MQNAKISEAVDMMLRTTRMHKALIESRVKAIGIHRTQHKILMILARSDKLPSQKELADHLGITPAAVTGALKKIERDGYVERNIGQDNRFNELKITEKGRELVELTKRRFNEADRSIFDGFTTEELSSYISFHEKLQKNIQVALGDTHHQLCREKERSI